MQLGISPDNGCLSLAPFSSIFAGAGGEALVVIRTLWHRLTALAVVTERGHLFPLVPS